MEPPCPWAMPTGSLPRKRTKVKQGASPCKLAGFTPRPVAPTLAPSPHPVLRTTLAPQPNRIQLAPWPTPGPRTAWPVTQQQAWALKARGTSREPERGGQRAPRVISQGKEPLRLAISPHPAPAWREKQETWRGPEGRAPAWCRRGPALPRTVSGVRGTGWPRFWAASIGMLKSCYKNEFRRSGTWPMAEHLPDMREDQSLMPNTPLHTGRTMAQ